MISVATNPEGIDDAFLRGLEICFPGAWNEAIFRWHFRRAFAGRSPDTLAILHDIEPVSGMGLNYRQLATPEGDVVDVAVVTAAWTLPRHRGRGYLLRLLRTATQRARDRGCGAVLSFMTADNASAVLLRRAGAQSVPTFYISTTGGTPLEPDALGARMSPEDGNAPSAKAITFHYASRDDWRAQFIDRPLPTESVTSGDTTTVVERAPTADRLLMLRAPPDRAAEALSVRARTAQAAGRSFFHVTTSPELARASHSRGFAVRAGHLMVQDVATPPNRTIPLRAAWHVHSGDRM